MKDTDKKGKSQWNNKKRRGK